MEQTLNLFNDGFVPRTGELFQFALPKSGRGFGLSPARGSYSSKQKLWEGILGLSPARGSYSLKARPNRGLA